MSCNSNKTFLERENFMNDCVVLASCSMGSKDRLKNHKGNKNKHKTSTYLASLIKTLSVKEPMLCHQQTLREKLCWIH